MNQNFKLKKANPEMLFYDGIVLDNEKIWLIIKVYSILVEIDQNTGIISPCGVIPNRKKVNIPYRFLLKYEKKLILLPYNATDICIYDIDKKKFSHIELDTTRLKGNDTWKFTGYEKINSRMVIYGDNSWILIINLFSFEIEYLNLKEKLPEDLEIKYWFWGKAYSKDSKLFLVPLSYSCVIELNVHSESVKYYKLPKRSDARIVDNPVFDESILFYFDRDNDKSITLKQCDFKSGKFTAYDLGLEQLGKNRVFGFVVCIDNVLWMLPGEYGIGYKYDAVSGKLEKLNDLPVVSESKLIGNVYPYEFNYSNAFLTEDGHILAVHAWSCRLVNIDTHNGSIKVKPIFRNDNIKWIELFKELYNNPDENIFKEWDSAMLPAFLIDSVSNNGRTIKYALKNKFGNKIYNNIKEK